MRLSPMSQLFLISTFLLTSALSSFSQLLKDRLDPPPEAMAHVHQHAAVANDTMTPGTIDGAKNPELIPDATAYRLFFVVLGLPPSATAEDRVHQSAHLTKLEFKDNEATAFVDTLASFRTQYDDLIKNYNDSALVASDKGGTPDYDAFVVERDALVQSTRDRLKDRLSADALSHLDQVVQSEKRHMRTLHSPTK